MCLNIIDYVKVNHGGHQADPIQPLESVFRSCLMRVSGWSGAASGGSIRRWYAAFPLVTTAKQIVRNWSRLPASWRISSGGSASAVEGRRGTSIHACCPSSSRTRYASRSDLENINLAETYVAPSTGYAVGCCQLSRLGKGEISHGIVGGWRSLSRSLAAKIIIRIQFSPSTLLPSLTTFFSCPAVDSHGNRKRERHQRKLQDADWPKMPSWKLAHLS